MLSAKIWAALIILTTGAYINAATNRDISGIWESWTVLYAASKINTKSTYKLAEKLRLNNRAMLSSPSPWLIVQRIELYSTGGDTKCCKWERERLKTLWNIDTDNLKER